MDQATRQDGPAVTAEGPRAPDKSRDDIRHTREQLGETAAALAAKADIKAQAKARPRTSGTAPAPGASTSPSG